MKIKTFKLHPKWLLNIRKTYKLDRVILIFILSYSVFLKQKKID